MAKGNGKTKRNGKQSFWGWRRENGRVGVRNHVIILPLDDLSNAAFPYYRFREDVEIAEQTRGVL